MERHKTEFKRWCVENGHTARAVADKTGLSLQAIYSYMEGRRHPSRKAMKTLSDSYGLDMREYFPL